MNYELKIKSLKTEFVKLMYEWYDGILEETNGKGYKECITSYGRIVKFIGKDELAQFYKNGWFEEWDPSQRLQDLRIILKEFDELESEMIYQSMKNLIKEYKGPAKDIIEYLREFQNETVEKSTQ
jgi:hypothetical protein